MVKVPLTKSDIKTLVELMRAVFRYLQSLRDDNVLADRIQFPKIPSILSESITVHLINDKGLLHREKQILNVRFGGKKADILVETGTGLLKVEVKGTGESGFEYFSEKDINADYLVWVHFGDFFKNASRKTVDIVTVRNPRDYFKGTMKITLDKFEKTSAYRRESLNLEEF